MGTLPMTSSVLSLVLLSMPLQLFPWLLDTQPKRPSHTALPTPSRPSLLSLLAATNTPSTRLKPTRNTLLIQANSLLLEAEAAEELKLRQKKLSKKLSKKKRHHLPWTCSEEMMAETIRLLSRL